LNRSEAALALGSMGGADVVAALARAGASDPFYGIRMDAAASLARMKSEEARPALLQMLVDKEPQVRAAAAGALGSLNKNPATIERLFQIARSDASLGVRQSALLAAARQKPEKGLDLAMPFLKDPSMKPAAVSAIEFTGDEAAVNTLLELSHDTDDRVRQIALRAFGTFGKGKQPVTDRLLEALDDQEKGDRQTAVFALQQRRDSTTTAALERLANSESLPNIARAARAAAEALRAPARTIGAAPVNTDELSSLRSRLSELEKENSELKARLDRLEKK
jgi:HEAT repeat protein